MNNTLEKIQTLSNEERDKLLKYINDSDFIIKSAV